MKLVYVCLVNGNNSWTLVDYFSREYKKPELWVDFSTRFRIKCEAEFINLSYEMMFYLDMLVDRVNL